MELSELQHFILTRFNILLWRQDKEGRKVRVTRGQVPCHPNAINYLKANNYGY